MFKPLVVLLWSMCLFQRGPETVPRSWLLFSVVMTVFFIAYTVQITVSDTLVPISILDAFIRSFILFLSIAIFCALVLGVRGYLARFQQTMVSLIGAQFLINLFVIPLFFLAPYIMTKNPSLMVFILGMCAFIFLLTLNIWHLLVNAFIYHRSLGVSFILGLLISFSSMGFSLLCYSYFNRLG